MFFWQLFPESISKLAGGGGSLQQLPDAKGQNNAQVMTHAVTIEVYKTGGPIYNSGLAFNRKNKREEKGHGLSKRHTASAEAPKDELGVFAQGFCRAHGIKKTSV